jgi:hypothetical protein
VPERKVRLLVGWVEPDLLCYDNQAFNTIGVQGAKPNNSIRGVFVQSLIRLKRVISLSTNDTYKESRPVENPALRGRRTGFLSLSMRRRRGFGSFCKG